MSSQFYKAPPDQHTHTEGSCDMCWHPSGPDKCQCGGRLHSDPEGAADGMMYVSYWCESCQSGGASPAEPELHYRLTGLNETI